MRYIAKVGALLSFLLPLFYASSATASVAYQTTSDWGTGFNGQITVVNDTGAVLNNWTLEFDFDSEITSIWNAVITSHTGSHYVVSPASWNSQIAINTSIDIGFGGSPGNITTGARNLVLNGAGTGTSNPPPDTPPDNTNPSNPSNPSGPLTGISVAVVQTSLWDGGYGANFVITNNGTTTVNGWTLNVTFAQPISSVWNGNVSNQGNAYTITNADWDGTIAPGSSVTVGFNGDGTLAASTASNCLLNASPCTLSVTTSAPPPPTSIALSSIDAAVPALVITVPQGSTSYPISLSNGGAGNFSVAVSNSTAVSAVVTGGVLQVTGLAAGRSSLKLTDSVTGVVRYLGVRVRDTDGAMPGLPKYLSVGSVSEDTTDDLAFWQAFQPAALQSGLMNKRVDIRYIYLNGGPVGGWDTWGATSGDRATNYIRNSRQLGMIPFFVYYNIPDGGESYYTDSIHIADPTYMAAYFKNLKLALDIINQESPDDIVGMILEPDFLGYLAQNANAPASAIAAMTNAAYASGVLVASVDPQFPNTVQGLVQAINYTISKYAPQVYFGWQVNLWASPAGGWTTLIPGRGIVHKTETEGLATGRQLIYNEAAAITNYYLAAGINTYRAKFVSIDKYGLDAAGYEASAAADPADSYWFWNNDLWQNYLTFVRGMKDTSHLPVILWQIPVGHINTTAKLNPYNPAGFPDLTNNDRMLEDSAPTFLLGDTFSTTGTRFDYFSTNLGADPKVTAAGNSITWGSHMQDVANAGAISVLFGAGVGASTNGIGTPTDSYWWITGVQGYYLNPVPLQ